MDLQPIAVVVGGVVVVGLIVDSEPSMHSPTHSVAAFTRRNPRPPHCNIDGSLKVAAAISTSSTNGHPSLANRSNVHI